MLEKSFDWITENISGDERITQGLVALVLIVIIGVCVNFLLADDTPELYVGPPEVQRTVGEL